MFAELPFSSKANCNTRLALRRHNDANETILCRLEDETEVLADLTGRSQKLGADLDGAMRPCSRPNAIEHPREPVMERPACECRGF